MPPLPAQARSSTTPVLLIVGGVAAGMVLLVCLGIGSIMLIGKRTDNAFATTPVGGPSTFKAKDPTDGETEERKAKAQKWREAQNNLIKASRAAVDANDQWEAAYGRGLRGRQMKPFYDGYVAKMRDLIAAYDACLEIEPNPEDKIAWDICLKEVKEQRQVLSNLYRASEDQGNIK